MNFLSACQRFQPHQCKTFILSSKSWQVKPNLDPWDCTNDCCQSSSQSTKSLRASILSLNHLILQCKQLTSLISLQVSPQNVAGICSSVIISLSKNPPFISIPNRIPTPLNVFSLLICFKTRKNSHKKCRSKSPSHLILLYCVDPQ